MKERTDKVAVILEKVNNLAELREKQITAVNHRVSGRAVNFGKKRGEYVWWQSKIVKDYCCERERGWQNSKEQKYRRKNWQELLLEKGKRRAKQ